MRQPNKLVHIVPNIESVSFLVAVVCIKRPHTRQQQVIQLRSEMIMNKRWKKIRMTKNNAKMCKNKKNKKQQYSSDK